MNEWLAVAAGTDTSVSPLYFVIGGLAVVVVSILGPLSRLHERRDQQSRAAAAKTAAARDTAPGPKPEAD